MVVNIIKFIALVVITYLMCRIITNNRKGLSVLGTLLICFSTAILEYMNSGLVEALLFGQGIVILINEFLNNKTKAKYLALIGISLGIVGFLLLSNATWQISIGTVLIALIVWIFIKNKKEVDRKNVILLLIFSIVSTIISILFYNYNVVKGTENGPIIYYLTSYFYSYILPFNEEIKFVTHGALTCMISVFPLPLILALVYMYKNEKHMEFVLPMVIVGILQIVASTFISKIVPIYIMGISVSLCQIYLLIYFFANVKEKVFSIKGAGYATIAYLVLVATITVPEAVSSRIMLSTMALGTTLESFIFCKYDDPRMQKIAPTIYGIITLIGFIATIFV